VRSPLLAGTLSEYDGATRLGAVRIGLGGLLFLGTGLARRLFGVPAAQDSGALRLVARLFGARNIVIGLWVLRTRDAAPEDRRACYQLNTAIDALDLAALGVAGASREGLWKAVATGSVLASSAVTGWLELASRIDTSAETE
jgi:hypothetical protein